ncbi:MAG: sodium:proton antiporter [Flavobacteriales bacterium]|jgi:NhaP-type Na+/H+ or K+/H+ antiporter|nr:sodium:proton antiporter [Flavobacteriales bacterium]|tara:strand:+ start:13464 stop:14723 length:1260 start_codon:yes stop_codon:yes gene_type:complete
MNTGSILILLPLIIIFSYFFDLLAKKTKFPSVILLMITGMIARAIANQYGFENTVLLNSLIPVLGTIGLILIVMEGALELEIKKEKIGLIFSGFLAAFVILILNIILLKSFFINILEIPNKTSVLYAIPLSIISSAVVIPSANGLLNKDKEFIIYESTFSDILGIVFFNYCLQQIESNQSLVRSEPLIQLGLQILGIIFLSLVLTYFLAKLIQKINHHVKFFLILAILILVYAVGKSFHFPTLLTIFIFGVFLGNGGDLLPRFMTNTLDVEETKKSLFEFHVLTSESTFLVRTFFFLFFGFSITMESFISPLPYFYALAILLIMFGARHLYFSIARFNFNTTPLVYMSPRGLISILLFLQLGTLNDTNLKTNIIDERVLLLVILFSMLIMLLGTLKKTEIIEDIPLEIETPIDEELNTD